MLIQIQALIEPYNQEALYYPWRDLDPRVGRLYKHVYRLVQQYQQNGSSQSRPELFAAIWQAALETAPELGSTYPLKGIWDLAAKPVPRLSESWY